MADEQTIKDQIEDLLIERAKLYATIQRLEAEVKRLETETYRHG